MKSLQSAIYFGDSSHSAFATNVNLNIYEQSKRKKFLKAY